MRFPRFAPGLLLGLLLIFPGAVLAQEAATRNGLGGLVLLEPGQLHLVQEVLEISPDKLRVQYRWRNPLPHLVTSHIVFPMTRYGWYNRSTERVGPLQHFSARVDGRKVRTVTMRDAVVEGRGVTGQLRASGLSERQIFNFADCDFHSSAAEKCSLTPRQRNYVRQITGSDEPAPWEIQETLAWGQEQRFHAGQEVELVLEYRPFAGRSSDVRGAEPATAEKRIRLPVARSPFQPGFSEDPKAACIDEGTRAAVQARADALLAGGARAVRITLSDVEYVMQAERDPKTPIADFRLRIVKQSPGQLVTLCFDGKPRRVDARTLEFMQAGFVAQAKLVVYFYTVEAAGN